MTDAEQKKVFAKNLNHFLWLNNKSQKEVAEFLNIKLSTFNSWCTATKLPRMNKVQMLADYFDIKKSDLIEDKIDKQNEGYYLNEETKKIAQEVYDNKDLRILFDATKDINPEDLKLIIDMAKHFKNRD